MNEQEIKKIVELAAAQCNRRMTLELAKVLIDKIALQATRMNVAAVIAVADQGANPVAVQRMDEAYIASYDIAVNKAYTAAALKMSTEQLGRLSQPGQPLYGIQHSNAGRIVIFGGGEVLEVNGRMIGALGVSGGNARQDTDLAAYGKEIFEEVFTCL